MMKVIYTDADFARLDGRPLALTIGNFDGIHLGHVSLLDHLKQRARELGCATAVMTFHPHPAHVVAGEQENFDLMTIHDKIEAIGGLGIDYVIVQHFDREFSELDAEDFLADAIDRHIVPKLILFGFDFRFGRNRAGDIATARAHYAPLGVLVEEGGQFSLGEEKVSSTTIRRHVVAGEVEEAAALLGHPYTISGWVIHGKLRGRQLGFPTANIGSVEVAIPKDGVYAVEVLITDAKGPGPDAVWCPAAMNIGFNPTFADVAARALEVFIFDFAGDIYGDRIFTRMHMHIRDEVKFPSVEALKRQVDEDIDAARRFFAHKKSSGGTKP